MSWYCKKHPRYSAIREPRAHCRKCWRLWADAKVTRALDAAHKAARGQMVLIDVGALKKGKSL